MKKQVRRFDTIDPPRWMTRGFTRTAEGFLQGRAIVTSVGVFTYLNADGSVTRELRLPEEVFDSESLNTLKLKPVTLDHPAEKVTTDNADKYQIGTLGTNPSSTAQETERNGRSVRSEDLTDGFHIAIDMSIHRADAVNEVLNGKRSLSMGYECETEAAEPGAVWCGMAYDSIQRNIRYNHCAIVDIARAGDAAQIHLDSADAVQIRNDGNTELNQEVRKLGMKKIHLDGVEYEGDEVLVLKFTEQRNRADAAEKALSELKSGNAEALSVLEAERDTCKDRADKAEQELKTLKEQALDPKRIDEAVKAKIVLLDAADRAGVKAAEDMSDGGIKKAVITALFPAAKLDGKDEVYISARFDAAVEALNERAGGANREAFGGSMPAGAADRSDSAAAYKRMIDRLKARSAYEKAEGAQ